MPEKSAGIVMYRSRAGVTEVLLIHPGGPFWARKDAGAWSIPKGVVQSGEDALTAARREFEEETGYEPPVDGFALLGDFRQPSRKIVTAYAVAGDVDLGRFRSNTFTMEWPPHSGVRVEFPEADRAEWFSLKEAALRILRGQRPVIAALAERLR
jgi:predicted NUDIX family NTP pyrophosphohydrolase